MGATAAVPRGSTWAARTRVPAQTRADRVLLPPAQDVAAQVEPVNHAGVARDKVVLTLPTASAQWPVHAASEPTTLWWVPQREPKPSAFAFRGHGPA